MLDETKTLRKRIACSRDRDHAASVTIPRLLGAIEERGVCRTLGGVPAIVAGAEPFYLVARQYPRTHILQVRWFWQLCMTVHFRILGETTMELGETHITTWERGELLRRWQEELFDF